MYCSEVCSFIWFASMRHNEIVKFLRVYGTEKVCGCISDKEKDTKVFFVSSASKYECPQTSTIGKISDVSVGAVFCILASLSNPPIRGLITLSIKTVQATKTIILIQTQRCDATD